MNIPPKVLTQDQIKIQLVSSSVHVVARTRNLDRRFDHVYSFLRIVSVFTRFMGICNSPSGLLSSSDSDYLEMASSPSDSSTSSSLLLTSTKVMAEMTMHGKC
ncbi:hypothetical protein M9H77_25109 [Catharanthus roseus]|uniref:Uncharacterized protein n=1 Tax=Catharanthus roseus TaxID=4058 RepID=A0ACC0A6U8_CATRO|nr:hypothetical protein M9H77_25109 [Catharanthus roseus]